MGFGAKAPDFFGGMHLDGPIFGGVPQGGPVRGWMGWGTLLLPGGLKKKPIAAEVVANKKNGKGPPRVGSSAHPALSVAAGA